MPSRAFVCAIAATAPGNFDLCMQQHMWGLTSRGAQFAQQVRPGDTLWFHVGGAGFRAHATALSGPEPFPPEASPPWDDRRTYVARIRIDSIVPVDPPVPIHFLPAPKGGHYDPELKIYPADLQRSFFELRPGAAEKLLNLVAAGPAPGPKHTAGPCAWCDSPDHLRALDVLSEQARYGQLVPFVGAGASAKSGLPTWKELIQELTGEKLAEGADLLDPAQWYADANGREALVRRVAELMRRAQHFTLMDKALAALQAPIYFTTNYDRLLETALVDVQKVPPDVVIQDGQVATIDEARRTTVVKLHGCLSIPNSIVLTRDDYESYAANHHAMIAYLQSLLATRTLLFAGFSLRDPNFRTIHYAIRHALGSYRRPAYMLSKKPWPEAARDYWKRRGVHVLLFDDFPEIIEFVSEIAERSQRTRTAVAAAKLLGDPPPHPPLAVQPFLDNLHLLHSQLRELIDQARGQGLIPSSEEDIVDVLPAAEGEDASSWLNKKARALLELGLAVDRLAPISDPEIWADLGDVLYAQRDLSGATAAYHAAIRPAEDGKELSAPTLRRVFGNLGRALADQGDHARAEWMLRHCIFKPGQETADGQINADAVHSRLDVDHLRRRPTDASRFASVACRRAEQLGDGCYCQEASDLVAEARYALAPVVDHSSRHYYNLHLGDCWGRSRNERSRFRELRVKDSRWHPQSEVVGKAYALNFFGKCFKLSCLLAADLGNDHVGHYLNFALINLKEASDLAPYLPYPYAHRLELATDRRINHGDRQHILSEVAADLSRLPACPQTSQLIHGLRQRFPKVKDRLPADDSEPQNP